MENSIKSSVHVLVVEDNEMNQRLIQIILEKGGHEFTLAKDGNEAIGLFEKQKYDAILMDCQMPNKDGFQATVEIRNIEKARQLCPTPILALTANSMVGDREKCLKSGMDDFLAKPFQMNALLSKINQIIEIRKKVDPL